MSDEQKINWNNALKPDAVNMNLKELEMGEPHVVTFLEVRQTPNNAIVATVDSETLEGETLWLRSAKYGGQNGLGSLLAAVEFEGNSIEGADFTITKVASTESPVGYAYKWAKV
tara:strand:+ start:7115 stop:7456 length:342 start_codon:yes stop_codon:yes gene_type:complete